VIAVRVGSVIELIEPVFAMASSDHERVFGVKSFFERVFAF